MVVARREQDRNMNFSDETLMAYADGELGEPERSAVEAAEREDPAVAASIARHRALRADVSAALAPVLDEPVPARLQVVGADAGADARARAAGVRADAGTRAGSGTIASLDAARKRKARARELAGMGEAPAASGVAVAGGGRRAWPRWGALAASLAVGVLAGGLWMGGAGQDPGFVATDGSGRLLAQGALAGALSQQLAAEAGADKRVRIGVSFAARGGGYCRSFTAGGSAGLACREGERWRIPVLQEEPAAGAAYRQAASTAPAAVLEVIDERIDGMTLDAAAERAARDRGWQR